MLFVFAYTNNRWFFFVRKIEIFFCEFFKYTIKCYCSKKDYTYDIANQISALICSHTERQESHKCDYIFPNNIMLLPTYF